MEIDKKYTKASEVFVFSELLKNIPYEKHSEWSNKIESFVKQCQSVDSAQRITIEQAHDVLKLWFLDCNQEIIKVRCHYS